MPTLRISVQLDLDGQPLPGTPLVRRLELDEAQTFDVEQATGGGFVAIQAAAIASIQALLLRADRQVTVRLDGQTDAGLVLNAGGLVLIFDATIDAGAATNVTVDNASGSTAVLRGVAAGT